VGSWQSYHADIIITGGWCAASPVSVPFSSPSSSSCTSSTSVSRIPIVLRAYIEL
jgi:hypothetical protein